MVELLFGLLLGTIVSGAVPLVNAELLVVAAAVAVPASLLPVVVAVSSLGQMLTKTLLFSLAKWAPEKLPQRARAALDRASERVSERGGAAGSVVFLSATLGLPPFYGVSLVCGALRMPMRLFLTAGTAGRILRFGVLAWAAHLVGEQALDLLTFSAPTGR
jgi:membrane protein YqaA with SNARE-associated domain